MAADTNNGQTKVTLALLAQRMDYQDKKLVEILDSVKDTGKQVDINCVEIARNKTDIENLKKQSGLWNALNSAGVVLAGIFGLNR